MAEALGAVASGISIATLAIQITSSVIKLKSCWDKIQDVPEEIKLLIDEIDCLRLVLSDIEEDQRRNPISHLLIDNSSASKCLEHCRRGPDRLKDLVDELGTDVYNPNRLMKKWAATKVVLKKEKIEKYKSHLKAALRLLSLSHQCYTR